MSFNIQRKHKCKTTTFGLIEVNSNPTIVGDGFIYNPDGTVTWIHNLNITDYNQVMFSPFQVVESLNTPDSITFLVDYMQNPTIISICALSKNDLYIRDNFPIARINSTYQGLTAFGDFSGTFELIDYQNNALQSGDEIELRFISQNGHFIASGLFLYGDDISSATPIIDNNFVSNIQPYLGSGTILQNGGTFTILKKPLVFNFNIGQLAGVNKGEELKIYIRANQVSKSIKSSNDDNFTTLTTIHESVFYSSNISRANILPGVTPNNPNPTFDYIYVTGRSNAGYTVSEMLDVINNNMDYGHYYNNTAGVLENTPTDTVTGIINRTTGYYSPSILLVYWITLPGTSGNTSGFYKRHRTGVSVNNYPLLPNESIINTIEQTNYIKNTTYRIAYNVHGVLNTPISTSDSMNYSIFTYSGSPFASAPPNLFTTVDTWISSIPNQDPLLGTQIANYTGNNANQINTFTSAGDGEYIILTRGLDASNNVIASCKSLIIQISY